MTDSFRPQDLDTILALQLSIAWAGEKAEAPSRLNWWDTDLIHPDAGGDLFKRLLPKTAPWAGLEMARRAAIRTDAAARELLGKPDSVVSLFHFGFELDEALDDHLDHLKRKGESPAEALGEHLIDMNEWRSQDFEAFLAALPSSKFESLAVGRFSKGVTGEPSAVALQLASGLLPLEESYPLPHARLPESW